MSDWLPKLQRHIFTDITPLLIGKSPDAVNLRKKLVTEEAMVIWKKPYTHRSFNPNDSENSEPSEYVGDAIMGVNFAIILTTKYPNITAEVLTDLKNAKVWKYEQARIADDLGLAKYLRTNVPISVSDKEDILEGIFGALIQIGEIVFGDVGNGFVLCRNLMINLYGGMSYEFDTLKIKAPANQLKEIGDKLKWWKDKTGSVDEFGIARPLFDQFKKTTGYELTYTLNSKAIRWLRSQGHEIINEGIIAHQTRDGKKDTKNAAIQEALINLKKYYGIDWVTAAQSTRLVKEKDQGVLKRMERDGVINIEIERYDKEEHNGMEYYQLLGIKADRKKIILLTAVKDPTQGKINENIELINYYKNHGAQDPSTIIRLDQKLI